MIETIHWHTLHPRYLGPQSRILDLGANYGQFSEAVTQRFKCRCVAVEPAPSPFAAIRENALVNKIQAAVAVKSGVMPFYIHENSVASSLTANSENTIKVDTFSLADLMKLINWAYIDLLKVDIEGAEISMLASSSDETLSKIGQITIEFHDFCGITQSDAVLKTLDRLKRLGFVSVRMSRVGHQDTWLLNRKMLPITTTELLWIRYVVRNWRGFKRVLSRFVAGTAR
jgi:FkbM family methyltransferase